MTRTDLIAQAIVKELRSMANDLNKWPSLRSIAFDVKLKPGTSTIRAIIVRPEFEHVGDPESRE